MTGLACWLAVIALADLARSGRTVHGAVRLTALTVPALLLLGLAALVAGPGPVGVVAWSVGAAALVVWIVASSDGWAGAGPSGAAPRLPRYASALAFGALLAGAGGFALAGDRAGDAAAVGRLLAGSVFGGVDPGRVLLVTAVGLTQLGTANLVVRLVLDRVGVPAPDHEKRLRGGRFLGPMERVLIVGLGLAGTLGGAAVVVAAKALLRFPEVREASRGAPGGASDVTEYFLVGSFTSWLLAFAGLAVCAL